ncbi:MAG: metallophosphoesterase, partial [Halioglobus sp.]|nr:metallophosphoesterase [Halioglobus sp.]
NFDIPVHCIPGNHDIREYMRAALSSAPFHYCDSYSRRNWLIVGLDSCKTNSAGGHVAPDEIRRLHDIVDGGNAEHVLICLHHPPLAMGSRWLDGVVLDDGAGFLNALERIGKVRGCLFGHVHQAFDTVHKAMRIIGTPSTCRQFLPGSDEFALDDQPPAYRRVELNDDGSIASELIWVPMRSQPGETSQ